MSDHSRSDETKEFDTLHAEIARLRAELANADARAESAERERDAARDESLIYRYEVQAMKLLGDAAENAWKSGVDALNARAKRAEASLAEAESEWQLRFVNLIARVERAEADLAAFRRELDDDSPGTPLGRLDVIANKPSEVFLIEAYDRLRREKAELVEALRAYVEHMEDESETLPCCQKIFDQAVAALHSATVPP